MLPLAPLLKKSAGSLTDEELKGVAYALTGEQANEFLPLLIQLRDVAPGEATLNLLGSPAAGKLYARMREAANQEDSTIFCKCPACGFVFEDELK
jgi:hypothetical protein